MLACMPKLPPGGISVNRDTEPLDGHNSDSHRLRGYFGMDDEAAIARRIQLARLGRRLTQRQLGEALGTSKQAVTNMETGGRGISNERLREIAEVLQVSYSYFVAGITQASDIDVIVEGARQAGWDEAVARMRESLDALMPSHNDGGGRTRRARISRPDEDEVLPDPAKQPKRKGA